MVFQAKLIYQQKAQEHVVRSKILARFMDVMGPDGPGLAVKKYHRS